MKKIVGLLLIILIACLLLGCIDLSEDEGSEEKEYHVGDTQTFDGVSLKVTNVESGYYLNYKDGSSEKSQNGYWVKVSFTIEKEGNRQFTIYGIDFRLNDTYTMRDITYRHSKIESGFEVLEGNKYQFNVVFDSSYSHDEKDLRFLWSPGTFFDKTYVWIL